MRTTVLEVDTNLFKQNVSNIKKYIGNKSIMPVIKANAYGTYINKRIDLINDFDIMNKLFRILEFHAIAYLVMIHDF